jgi:hypothetical protein
MATVWFSLCFGMGEKKKPENVYVMFWRAGVPDYGKDVIWRASWDQVDFAPPVQSMDVWTPSTGKECFLFLTLRDASV